MVANALQTSMDRVNLWARASPAGGDRRTDKRIGSSSYNLEPLSSSEARGQEHWSVAGCWVTINKRKESLVAGRKLTVLTLQRAPSHPSAQARKGSAFGASR